MQAFSFRRLFQVPPESVTHCGEQFVLVIRFTARTESLVEGRREYRHRHAFIDGRLDRPSPLTGVRNPARESREAGILNQGSRRQIQQP
jgi:hypothetical protein